MRRLEGLVNRGEIGARREAALARSVGGDKPNGHLHFELDKTNGFSHRDFGSVEERGLGYEERMTDYLVRERGLKPIENLTFGNFCARLNYRQAENRN